MGRPPVFTPDKQEQYLAELRRGTGRLTAARLVDVDPDTVRRFRKVSPDWIEKVHAAEYEAAEPVEQRLYEAALAGEPWAVKMWTQGRMAGRWRERTDVAVSVSGSVVLEAGPMLAEIATLRQTLEQRSSDLLALAGPAPASTGEQDREVVDAEIVRVSAPEKLPVLGNSGSSTGEGTSGA